MCYDQTNFESNLSIFDFYYATFNTVGAIGQSLRCVEKMQDGRNRKPGPLPGSRRTTADDRDNGGPRHFLTQIKYSRFPYSERQLFSEEVKTRRTFISQNYKHETLTLVQKYHRSFHNNNKHGDSENCHHH